MRVKSIIWEDTVNYRKPSLFIGTARCSFKCRGCQNRPLSAIPDIIINDGDLIDRYLGNTLTEAIVLGGLEPLDQMDEIVAFCTALNQKKVSDDLVIYTGYTESEAEEKVGRLREANQGRDLIVKYGRYDASRPPAWDELLGVKLISDNQYAVRYPVFPKTQGGGCT